MNEAGTGREALSKVRMLVLLLALCALVAQVLPSASVAAAPRACDAKVAGKRPVRLCSVTKLSGRKTGYVRVNVTKETTLTPDGVTVTGGKGFAGFLFKQEVERQPIEIIGGHVRWKSGDHDILCCEKRILAPGTYRLYLITQAPASVTLKLSGLARGRTRLAPTKATGVSVHEPTPHVVTQNVSQYQSAGVTESVDSDALVFTGTWVENDVHVATASGTCVYFGEAPADAFAPGCPWRTSELTVWQDANGIGPSADGFRSGIITMSSGLPPGTYSAGGYAVSGGTADKPSTLVVFLEFD